MPLLATSEKFNLAGAVHVVFVLASVWSVECSQTPTRRRLENPKPLLSHNCSGTQTMLRAFFDSSSCTMQGLSNNCVCTMGHQAQQHDLGMIDTISSVSSSISFQFSTLRLFPLFHIILHHRMVPTTLCFVFPFLSQIKVHHEIDLPTEAEESKEVLSISPCLKVIQQ